MPKVMPLGEHKRLENRWTKADVNFRAQIGALLAVSRMTELQLANRIGIKSWQTFKTKLDNPAKLWKEEERRLAGVFEEYGLKYDFTMGEGGAAVCHNG